MPECPCVLCEGLLFIFSVRAAFLDACCLFLQCVQAVIPLIGDVQVHGLCVLLERCGPWVAPASGAWSPGLDHGSDSWELGAVVCT